MKIINNDIELEIKNIRLMYRKMATDSISPENAYSIMGSDVYELDNSYLWLLTELSKIEVFVTKVLASNQPGFRLKQNKFFITALDRELPLGKYFQSVVEFYSYCCKPGFKFSEYVQLFFDCWNQLDLDQEGFTNPLDDSSKQGKKQFEVYNDLLDLIRTNARSPEFRKKVGRRKEKSSKRFASAKSYINRLFDNCSRMEVLRIDFSYQHEYSNKITDQSAKKDLNHFMNNWRGNPTLFQHLEGHIWKLEWGPGKGLHFHLILFFNSGGVLKDAYLADLIGKYWVEGITKGTGLYWNCNASKYKYRKLGIGRISAADDELRKNLLDEVVGYLVKTEQYLRAHKLGEGKLFGHGEIKVKSPAGRPRKKSA